MRRRPGHPDSDPHTSTTRRPGRDETFRAAAVCRRPRLSGGATFKTQRQLVAESLVFDRCRNDRFVEKPVKAGYIGQLIGALLNESAVAGAAARPSPGGNSAIAILERRTGHLLYVPPLSRSAATTMVQRASP